MRPVVEQATMRLEIIEPEAGVVDSESTGICSGKVPVQSIHPRPATPSTGDLHLKLGSVSNGERQLESAEASSMAVILQTCYRSVGQW